MKTRLFYFLTIFVSLNSLMSLAPVWAEEASDEKVYTVSPVVSANIPVYPEEKVYTVSPVVNATIPTIEENKEVEYEAVIVVNANFQVRQEPTQYYNATQVYIPVYTIVPPTDTAEAVPADTEESGDTAPEGNQGRGHGRGRGNDHR